MGGEPFTNFQMIKEIVEWLESGAIDIPFATNRGTNRLNIDLEFFRELWSFQTLQMTISKETLPNLTEGVLDMQEKGYKINAALAEGVNWTKKDALIYREQLCLLKDFYLKNMVVICLRLWFWGRIGLCCQTQLSGILRSQRTMNIVKTACCAGFVRRVQVSTTDTEVILPPEIKGGALWFWQKL